MYLFWQTFLFLLLFIHLLMTTNLFSGRPSSEFSSNLELGQFETRTGRDHRQVCILKVYALVRLAITPVGWSLIFCSIFSLLLSTFAWRLIWHKLIAKNYSRSVTSGHFLCRNWPRCCFLYHHPGCSLHIAGRVNIPRQLGAILIWILFFLSRLLCQSI